jgi:hypothetical protein
MENISNNSNFALTRDGAYYIPLADEMGRSWLKFQDFRTSSRTTVAPIEGLPMWGLAVSPDGRSILHVGIRDGGGSDLMLVENFR